MFGFRVAVKDVKGAVSPQTEQNWRHEAESKRKQWKCWRLLLKTFNQAIIPKAFRNRIISGITLHTNSLNYHWSNIFTDWIKHRNLRWGGGIPYLTHSKTLGYDRVWTLITDSVYWLTNEVLTLQNRFSYLSVFISAWIASVYANFIFPPISTSLSLWLEMITNSFAFHWRLSTNALAPWDRDLSYLHRHLTSAFMLSWGGGLKW